MKENRTDIFEINKNHNSLNFNKVNNFDDSNFFLQENTKSYQKNNKNITESTRHLNDYDFNLLKEDAYKDVTDDVFKLEYKISKIEAELKSLDTQLQTAHDINDLTLTRDLLQRKQTLEEDYEALLGLYNDKSISTKIIEGITNLFGANTKLNILKYRKYLIEKTEEFMSILPGPFSSFIELKKSLNKLENISKSVDELMTMNYPYGENFNKYEQLSKYIIKANSIQNEINTYINK